MINLTLKVGPDEAFLKENEFGHMHETGSSGSLHLVLPVCVAKEVTVKKWGELSGENESRSNTQVVLIFPPSCEYDVLIIEELVSIALRYAKGEKPANVAKQEFAKGSDVTQLPFCK